MARPLATVAVVSDDAPDWLRALMHGITANVDFDGQQIRNPQQNKRLYDILQAFKG